MSSITTLDGLFELAGADWNSVPPPLPNGGTAPQVATRTITVVASIRGIGTGGPLKVSKAGYTATLNYSPERKIPRSVGLPRIVPESFYGQNIPVGGKDATVLLINIVPADTGGYDISVEEIKQSSGLAPNPPLSVISNLPSPGGQQGEADPLVSISFTEASCTFEITQYTFLLTLKKA